MSDTNDCDYVTKRTEISEYDLEKFRPLISAINSNNGHNWATKDQVEDYNDPYKIYSAFREELIQEFGEYIPYAEYGVHMIESIILLRATEEVLL